MPKHTPTGGGKWKQGQFIPKNPDKYLGDVSDILYRSSWELEAFKFCDNNPHVIKWASEEIAIPYVKPSPTTGLPINSIYLPDLFVVLTDGMGEIRRELIEIKPKKQTQKSRARKPGKRLDEEYTLMVNRLKWEAAEHWCKQRNIRFRLLTEDDQFI